MIAFCKDKQRRNLVLQTSGLNGLDYLEVLGMPGCGSQLALTFQGRARACVGSSQHLFDRRYHFARYWH